MLFGLTNKIIVLDAETANPMVDLNTCGLANYWDNAYARTLMFGYQDTQIKYPEFWENNTTSFPDYLLNAAQQPPEQVMFAAYNAPFDKKALERCGINTGPEKWIDIMMLAYMLGFSGGLDDVLTQFHIKDENGRPLKKSPEGRRLIKLFSVLGKPWYEKPSEWQQFKNYCKQDVFVETQLLRKCAHFLDHDWYHNIIRNIHQQWLTLFHINERGMPINIDRVNAAIKIKDEETSRVVQWMRKATGLDNPNSVKQLQTWLKQNEINLSNLQKGTVQIALQEDAEIWGLYRDPLPTEFLDGDAWKLFPELIPTTILKTRLELGKASVKKFDAIARLQHKGRIKNGYTLLGASRTGRDASRGLNLANLERPKLKDVSIAAAAIDTGNLSNMRDFMRLWSPEKDLKTPVLNVLGSCVRACICAPRGKGIMAGDLKSIESIGAAWYAGCDTILDLFHEGLDTYKYFGSLFYNKNYNDVTPEERNFSKPPFLGFGYGASGQAIVDYAKNSFGLTISLDEAERAIEICRTAFSEIPHYWKVLDVTAKNAIKYPKNTFYAFAIDTVGSYGINSHVYRDWPYVAYYYDETFLYCQIPSGRILFYYQPRIENVKRTSRTGRAFEAENITYMGKAIAGEQGAWRRISTHGGKILENNTQGLMRDVLYNGIMLSELDPLIEVCGSTYDEIIALHDLDAGAQAFERLITHLTTKTDWMNDRFYLSASGYHSAPHYRKD